MACVPLGLPRNIRGWGRPAIDLDGQLVQVARLGLQVDAILHPEEHLSLDLPALDPVADGHDQLSAIVAERQAADEALGGGSTEGAADLAAGPAGGRLP